MPDVDQNSPGGRLHYFLKELLDSGFVPEEYEDEIRDALTTYEIQEEAPLVMHNPVTGRDIPVAKSTGRKSKATNLLTKHGCERHGFSPLPLCVECQKVR